MNGHPDAPLAPHDLAGAWNLAPGVVLPLLLSAAMYLAGTRTLWSAPGRGGEYGVATHSRSPSAG